MSAARSRRANDKHNHLQRTPILVMGCSLLIACCIALPKGTEITREIALDAKKHDALLLLTMSVD